MCCTAFRGILIFCLSLFLLVTASCALDLEGTMQAGDDGSVPDGVDSADFAGDHVADWRDDEDIIVPDGMELPDLPEDRIEDLTVEDREEDTPCTDGQLECLDDGSARRCEDGSWVGLGVCHLGCDSITGKCYHASNVPEDTAREVDRGDLVTPDFPLGETLITVSSDDGSITGGSGAVIRAAGEGLISGIFFQVVDQADDPARDAGVFIMESLELSEGVTLVGVGSNPMVFLVAGGVHIHGTIDVGVVKAEFAPVTEGHHIPGPGGYRGGDASTQGEGPCPGDADGGTECGTYCTSGGGGGGFGGRGGDGGDGEDSSLGCPTVFEGGAGGGPCGSSELRPVFGGSGGGGGGRPDDDLGEPAIPGKGGAGGGALQITSLELIHIYPTGIITSPGGGGGGATADGGGGGGGGAGGALLVEAPQVILDAGGILAANGGGGGAGDCT